MMPDVLQLWDATDEPGADALVRRSPLLEDLLAADGWTQIGILGRRLRRDHSRVHPDLFDVRLPVWRSADGRTVAVPSMDYGVHQLELLTLLGDVTVLRTVWCSDGTERPSGWSLHDPWHPVAPPTLRSELRVVPIEPAVGARTAIGRQHEAGVMVAVRLGGSPEEVLHVHAQRVGDAASPAEPLDLPLVAVVLRHTTTSADAAGDEEQSSVYVTVVIGALAFAAAATAFIAVYGLPTGIGPWLGGPRPARWHFWALATFFLAQWSFGLGAIVQRPAKWLVAGAVVLMWATFLDLLGEPRWWRVVPWIAVAAVLGRVVASGLTRGLLAPVRVVSSWLPGPERLRPLVQDLREKRLSSFPYAVVRADARPPATRADAALIAAGFEPRGVRTAVVGDDHVFTRAISVWASADGLAVAEVDEEPGAPDVPTEVSVRSLAADGRVLETRSLPDPGPAEHRMLRRVVFPRHALPTVTRTMLDREALWLTPPAVAVADRPSLGLRVVHAEGPVATLVAHAQRLGEGPALSSLTGLDLATVAARRVGHRRPLPPPLWVHLATGLVVLLPVVFVATWMTVAERDPTTTVALEVLLLGYIARWVYEMRHVNPTPPPSTARVWARDAYLTTLAVALAVLPFVLFPWSAALVVVVSIGVMGAWWASEERHRLASASTHPNLRHPDLKDAHGRA